MVLTRTKCRRKSSLTPFGSMWQARINYRYYNPTDGRWTRRDPIGIEGGLNLYRGLIGNPIQLIDHEGKGPFAVALLFILAAWVTCAGVSFYKATKFDANDKKGIVMRLVV